MSTTDSRQVDERFAISCRRLDDVAGLGALVQARSGRGVVLALAGEIDLATAPIVEGELRRAEASQNLIVVDLRDVSFMDSTGVRVLVAADRRNRERGAALVIVQGSPQVRRLFDLSGLTQHLEVLDGDDWDPRTGD